MKYVIYTRVSTDKQDYGTDAQITACKDWIIKKHGSLVDHMIFSDYDVSAPEPLDKKPNLIKAFWNLKSKDVLLVARRDRIIRDMETGCAMESMAKKRGATIACVNMDDEGMDAGTSKLMKSMMDAIAEYELWLISMRTRVGLMEVKVSGFSTGNLPYGFKGVANGKKTKKGHNQKRIEICPEENAIVNRILDNRKNGFTLSDCYYDLLDNGFRNRKGNPFVVSSIQSIIRDRPRHLAWWEELQKNRDAENRADG